jgi:hypothetical protein
LHNFAIPVLCGVSDAYEELDPASKLVLVAALRPDRLLTCIEKFICGEVGEQFVEKCELDLSAIVEESPPSAPLVIIADEKIDVVTALESLGRIIGVNVHLIFHAQRSESAWYANRRKFISCNSSSYFLLIPVL